MSEAVLQGRVSESVAVDPGPDMPGFMDDIVQSFRDLVPDDICVPCLVKSFAKGFAHTFLPALITGAVVGFLGVLAVGAGIVSAPVLLAVGLVVGAAAVGWQLGGIIANWNTTTAEQKAEAFGEMGGGLAGGFLGGAAGGAAGTATAEALSAAAASMGGPGLAIAGGGTMGGTAAAEGVAVATGPVGAGMGAGASAMTGDGPGGGGGKPPPKKGDYSNLKDPPDVEAGKDFTPAQKAKIIQENMQRNGGKVVSDDPADPYQNLSKPAKSQKDVTPSPDEWQIDHIVPKDKGGTNSYENARVISRHLNRQKSNK